MHEGELKILNSNKMGFKTILIFGHFVKCWEVGIKTPFSYLCVCLRVTKTEIYRHKYLHISIFLCYPKLFISSGQN